MRACRFPLRAVMGALLVGLAPACALEQPPPRDNSTAAGVYDMLSRTEVLTRPVQFVRLFRDGSLRSEPTPASRTEMLWRDVDEPQCIDWEPGFGFGDVDGPIWRYFDQPGSELSQPVKPRTGPKGTGPGPGHLGGTTTPPPTRATGCRWPT